MATTGRQLAGQREATSSQHGVRARPDRVLMSLPETAVPPRPLTRAADRLARPATPRLRRRRPTGAPAPLPRHLGWTTITWGSAFVVVTVGALVIMRWEAARRTIDTVDATILRLLADHRGSRLTEVAQAVNFDIPGWALFVVNAALLVVLILMRRWQHLFAFLGSVACAKLIGLLLIDTVHRPRPFDVTAIGEWRGFAMPSATALVVSFTVVGVIFGVVVPGRPRAIAKVVGSGVVAVVVAARLYLGVEHPSDVVVGVVLGVALPLLSFRFFAPNELFPVSYHRRKSAHLDIGGRRAAAIGKAVADQLSLDVIGIEPIGLAGSGGSTPMRLDLADGTSVFGKLYALTHVRADRWYKLFRTILYGRLEDETPFRSVRRLAQQEDYALRVMRDAGVRTAAPIGVVELTPGREYLVVTEFFAGADELGRADVDDHVIDQGLAIVRQLWDAGLAHRDIKPANLLVRHGELLLIDVAFAQVRPSSWREAIDLANMMLVLAVRTDADRVYARALLRFTPDEIAEAFAAVRGIASPSQLRAVMRLDGRDLIGRFRALAPARRPVPLQRWGARRVVLTAGLAVVAVVVAPNAAGMFAPSELPVNAPPTCGTDDVMVLMAQAVPTASFVPCTTTVPMGWTAGGVGVQHGRAQFWLHSDRAGHRAVVVTLQQDCDTEGSTEERSDVAGMRRLVQRPATAGEPSIRHDVGEGMCISTRLAAGVLADTQTLAAIDGALSLQPRGHLIQEVDHETGLTLCGTNAAPCAGGGS